MATVPHFTVQVGTCAFCAAQGEVCAVVRPSDRSLSICRECIKMGLEIFAVRGPRTRSQVRPEPSIIQLQSHGHACSFCSLRRGQVSFMLSGPGLFACDFCLTETAALLGIAP